jgi:radical SAM superfamily enzyme YgiQ (UPF0313 family)
MKILLINTPRSPHNGILEHASDEARFFIHKKLIGPPLNLLTLAEAIPEHEVIVWDTKGEYDLNPKAPALSKMVEELMIQHQPDIVGTTVITSEFYFGIEILQAAKKANPNVLTIIGGLHATLCIEDFTDPSIDVVCRGQAAHLFRNVVRAKEKGYNLENVPGIYLMTDGGLKKTAGKVEKWDAAGSNFLFPDRKHLERWRETYYVGSAPSPSTYLFSSLGCPYKCSFCTIWCEFEGNYYQREIESIITELKLIDYDIVRFADANTVVNIKFIDQLFTRIEEEQIKKTYIMDIRADTAVEYPWLIEKLARNGLKVVICGFESFREEELAKYNKKSTVGLTTKAIEIFHKNDIMLRGNYVIPNDYDVHDFEAMADFTSAYKVAYAGYTVLTPMPGSKYYEEVKGQIIDHDLSKYNFFNCVLPTKLPMKEYYERIANLWLIKKGKDVI